MLRLPVVVAEVLLQRQLGEQEGDLVARRRFRSSSVWMLLSPTIGAFSVLVGMSAVESDQLRVVGEVGAEPLAGNVVAVADQRGKVISQAMRFSSARTRVGMRAGLGLDRSCRCTG